MILINAKNYESGIGDGLMKTLKTIQNVQAEKKVRFSVAVNTLDLLWSCHQFSSDIDIFAQHCDDAHIGASTGKIVPEILKTIGVKGVIVNHSENRFASLQGLLSAIKTAKEAGLQVVACAETVKEGELLAQNSTADFIAIEPPELIGGDVSVSVANPEIISQSVHLIGKGRVMIGAGIKNYTDIAIAMHHGASGVLLSSGIMKSSHMHSSLLGLLL